MIQPNRKTTRGEIVRKGLLLAFCFALLLGMPSALRADSTNLVTNGGFETGTFTGWAISNAANDSLITVYGTPNSGSYAAEFGAYANEYDSITQMLITQAGASYTLSFWLYNNDGSVTDAENADFQVLWDGLSLGDINGGNTIDENGYTNFTFAVTGTGSDNLSFEGYDDPGYYNLDDISVTETPEPSSLLLLGTGLLIFAGFLRRKMA
jgi:hypothetical protein